MCADDGCNEVITKRGLPGPKGDRGASGEIGPQGPAGENGPGIVIEVDFITNPLSDGAFVNVATTIPTGSFLTEIYAVTTAGTMNGVSLKIGIETDQPDYRTIPVADVNGKFHSHQMSEFTTVNNRNIVLTAVGGNITTGEIKIIIEYK